jgi:NO-binding membrane sensor protein with MHYT domain
VWRPALPRARDRIVGNNRLLDDEHVAPRVPMPLSPVNAHPLAVPSVALLLAGAAGTAALLAHALRKVRSRDRVVALGWGVGGTLAIGTGLWTLQLALWYATQGAAAAWFAPTPFVAAWVLAVGGCAAALSISRWLPSQRAVNVAMLALLLPLVVLVFVVLGAAMAVAPHWQAVSAGPTLVTLVVWGGGFWTARSDRAFVARRRRPGQVRAFLRPPGWSANCSA